jgi:hypothetical protein
MPVIFIGEDESRNQVLVTYAPCIRRSFVHQLPRALQLFPRQVRRFFKRFRIHSS